MEELQAVRKLQGRLHGIGAKVNLHVREPLSALRASPLGQWLLMCEHIAGLPASRSIQARLLSKPHA